MNKPRRVQRKRTKGYKLPRNTIYVGRPTVWGNPFTAHDKEWEGETVEPRTLVLLYEILLHETFKLSGKYRRWQTKSDRELWQAFLEPLRGKNLACWCPLKDKDGNPSPCHADVLLRLANE